MLYASERTMDAMRWHTKHTHGREIVHPSYAGAWKYF